MAEAAAQPPEATRRGTTVVMPIVSTSPTASEMKRRRRRRSRLMSTTSSVMSAAAAGIPSPEKHKISNNEALMHIVKATIGGGFLSMPEAFHNAGLIPSIVGTALIGLAVLNMMAVIVRCSQSLRSGKYAAAMLALQKKKSGNTDDDTCSDRLQAYMPYDSKELLLPPLDYPDTVYGVFQLGARGRFSRWAPLARKITSISLVFTYYGVNIIYVCIIANTCKQLVDQYTVNSDVDSLWSSVHGLSIRWYPAIVALLIVPVGMVRLMKYLVPFSVTANVCLLAGTVAIFYFILFGDDGRAPLRPDEQARLLVWPPTRWTLFAGSALCSLEGVGMLLHVENAMSRPLELVGPPAYTLHKSMVVIIVLNIVLGVSGYLRYGDRCTGSVSLNLPPNNKLSDAIKIIIAFAILLTYGLQLTVTADLAWQALRKKITGTKNGTSDDGDVETTDEEEWTPKLTLCYYSMRFSLILGSILVAIAVPDIGPLVSLVGSVGFSMLGVVIPVAMDTVWDWHPLDHDGDVADAEPEYDGREVAVARAANGVGGTVATVNGGGSTTTTTTATTTNNDTAVANAAAAAAAVAASSDVEGNDNKTGGCRAFGRFARHVKNAVLMMLAMFTMVGGAYFNVLDIVNMNSGEVAPVI